MAHTVLYILSNANVLRTRGIPPDQADRSPLWGRIAYVCVALVALAVVSGCFTIRAHSLTLRALIRLPLIRLYLLIIYAWGICLIISEAVLRFGFGVTNKRLCLAAILLCLVFYVVDKVLMYLFLVERVYVVHLNRRSRWKDRWYLLNMVIVILGFGSIAVLSFVFPVFEVSKDENNCRIGLPFKITLPLLIYDVSINVYLTAHFVYIARPRVGLWRKRALISRRGSMNVDREDMNPDTTQENTLMRLARRTLKGMGVMLLGTVLNLAVLFHMSGQEQEWICFTLCTFDVTLGILALHWITSHPTEYHLGSSPANKPPTNIMQNTSSHLHSPQLSSPFTSIENTSANQAPSLNLPNNFVLAPAE